MNSNSLNQLLETNPSYLLGHRGARGEFFENSYQGFEHIQRLSKTSKGQLIGIEFDIQLTRDNKLVVFHDDSLLRLFKQQALVNQTSYPELKRLSQGNNYILLLEDMIPLLKDYQRIELEIKTHPRTHHNQLIAALSQTLNQPLFKETSLTLTSFDIKLHELLSMHPFLKTFNRGLLVEPSSKHSTSSEHSNSQSINSNLSQLNTMTSTLRPLSQTPNLAMQLGCTGIGLYYPLFSEDIIQRCRRLRLTTSAWTVNEVEDAKYLVKLGVNYIITDYPSLMLKS